MSVLEGFTQLRRDPKMVVSFSKNRTEFSRASIEALNEPPFALLMINKEAKQLAVVAKEEKEAGCRVFKGKQVRLSSKDTTKELFSLSGLDPLLIDSKIVKFPGKLVEKGVIIFDLSNPL